MGGATRALPSHLLIKLLVPCCPRLEKLLAVEHAVFVIQVILHFPSKEKGGQVLNHKRAEAHCLAAE